MPGSAYSMGHVASQGGVSTQTLNISTASNLGDAIAVGCVCNNNTVSATGVTDTQSNVYTPGPSGGTNDPCFWFVALTGPGGGPVVPLGTSDKQTISWSSSTAPKESFAVGCPGITTIDTAADPAVASGSSSTPSVTTNPLTASSETILAVEGNASGGGAITWHSGFTGLDSASLPSSLQSGIAYKVVTGTAAVTASGTISSQAWSISALCLYGVIPGGAVPPQPGGSTWERHFRRRQTWPPPPPPPLGAARPVAVTITASATSVHTVGASLAITAWTSGRHLATYTQPAPPVFPAGYGPLPADMATWITQNFSAVITGIVFRGTQQNAGQSMTSSAFNALQLDTIAEDIYGGWSASATSTQPAFSWLAPWTGWYEVTVTTIFAAPAGIRASGAVAVTGGTAEFAQSVKTPASGPGGCSASLLVACTGGYDYIQAGAAVTGSATTGVASVGVSSSIEIAYISSG